MPLLPRGVYVAPFLSPDGEQVVIAINEARAVVSWTVVRDEQDGTKAIERMWWLLDEVDPENARRKVGRSPMRLVRGATANILWFFSSAWASALLPYSA